ncbi:hypothetical protein K3495_g11575 [Podosphaera aphanis]|nr:hypothetical protein K3495_g11575 [Podosphaera aphanis]
MVRIAVKILPAELSNNMPEDIVQKSVTTSHVRLYITSITANYLFATGSALPSKLPMSSRYPKQSTDIEEPNVPSTEDEEPMELVNAEVEFILERSTTESRYVPTVATLPIDHALSTSYKSTPLSSTMPPPPP